MRMRWRNSLDRPLWLSEEVEDVRIECDEKMKLLTKDGGKLKRGCSFAKGRRIQEVRTAYKGEI